VYFIGANGFALKTYQPVLNIIQNLLQRLQGNNSETPFVGGIDIYEKATFCKDWNLIISDIIRDIELRCHGKIVGVGHSVGLNHFIQMSYLTYL
jgi:hypothetical protein